MLFVFSRPDKGPELGGYLLEQGSQLAGVQRRRWWAWTAGERRHSMLWHRRARARAVNRLTAPGVNDRQQASR